MRAQFIIATLMLLAIMGGCRSQESLPAPEEGDAPAEATSTPPTETTYPSWRNKKKLDNRPGPGDSVPILESDKAAVARVIVSELEVRRLIGVLEVTSFRLANTGDKSVSRFAIAFRFLDLNGTLLETRYIELHDLAMAVLKGRSSKVCHIPVRGPANAESVVAEVVVDRQEDTARSAQWLPPEIRWPSVEQ